MYTESLGKQKMESKYMSTTRGQSTTYPLPPTTLITVYRQVTVQILENVGYNNTILPNFFSAGGSHKKYMKRNCDDR